MLLKLVVFLVKVKLILASTPIIIPEGEDLTRINATTSEWLSRTCGITDERNGRRYPWAVSILYFGENKLGGTIISPYHILTAAHGFVKFSNYMYIYETFSRTSCVIWRLRTKKDLDLRMVAYGGDCINEESQSQGCAHPHMMFNRIKAVLLDFDFATGHCVNGHDWAIIEVENPIKFDANIRPICLPKPMQEIETKLTVAGWGRIFGRKDNRIRGIPLKYAPKCLIPFPDTRPKNVPDYLCAKPLNYVNLCHGHSGAGLVQSDSQNRSTIVGLTSFGSKGCPADETTVFTKVSIYLHEICYFTGVCYSL
uniref:Peptidase S1 domain-containing protein n=1 Tax=Acrobeloides nanus TaxID=290746 RepID=A0A914DGI9_9BILA